ncbi:MAG TPA: formylglycine-generating enzyme family protein, partial [Ignavibacteria bacterium]|nr:formylglycine-generating enzyme family protein [Ignavibacteria bacterium]
MLFLFYSCGKKGSEVNTELSGTSSGHEQHVKDSLKNCCESKPSRFGNSEETNTKSNPGTSGAGSNYTVQNTKENNHEGMVWVPGGEFTMGTDEEDAYFPEKPAHKVKVNGFWMDVSEVTNAEFKKFVDATGYVTVAEKKPDWNELKKQLPPNTPPPDAKDLVPASLVYVQPLEKTETDDVSQWWKWVPGANWKQPEGPGSNIEDKMDLPVVQIAYDDALAYCKWAGKRLPTEAEWEFAAKNCLNGKRFAWGDELRPKGKIMANTWQGEFPNNNKREDGYAGAAPVKKFPANCYGLYDMIGNVWEWTADWYDARAYVKMVRDKNNDNPKGPSQSNDPEDPYAIKRVVKGGSFLCSENYCVNYRPSARRGQAFDSGTSNIGFR